MNESPLLELEGVAKGFPNSGAILLDVTFTLCVNELVTVMGRSGAGKSTFLNILGLLDRPDDGRFLVRGQETTHLSQASVDSLRRIHFGYVFQHYYLIDHLTSAENVSVPAKLAGSHRAEATECAMNALSRVGMADRADAFPRTLSGGERQRVAIARAIVANPHILLCDEPTGNLDRQTADDILDLLGGFVSSSSSVVVVTHDERVRDRATRDLRLVGGRCLES